MRDPARRDVPAAIAEYLELTEEFDRAAGNLMASPRFYPGSPRIVQQIARSQDRLALCEKHPAEFEALRQEFEPALDGFVVSPENAREQLATFIKRAHKQLVIWDPKLTDPQMIRLLHQRSKAGVDIRVITDRYAAIYHEDMAALGVLPPDHAPRVTEHLDSIISMIERLIASGHAYEAKGHVLFHTLSFKEYGQLSGRDEQALARRTYRFAEMQAAASVLSTIEEKPE